VAYFPNGSSGEIFEAQCADCPLGAGWNNPNQKRLFDDEKPMKPCPTAFVQLSHNYDQVSNPKLREAMTILVDDKGICQTRKLLLEVRQEAEARQPL
jgi:hypothetical protein